MNNKSNIKPSWHCMLVGTLKAYKNYLYPDANDKITASLIAEKEIFKGGWDKSERFVLDLMKKFIQEQASSVTTSWFLDVGCGTGRLLPEFERYFDYILAIDPDFSQIEKAKDLVKNHKFANKLTFRVTPIEELDWKGESIDVILCSHVLQHVNTDSVLLILQKFRDLVKKEGLLLITTCHSRRGYDYYAKGYLKCSKVIEERIEKEEFNSLIFNEENILPHHFFSPKSITEVLENLGFRLLNFRVFHVLGKMSVLDKIIDMDHLVNSMDFLKTRLGRDMLLIAQKTG